MTTTDFFTHVDRLIAGANNLHGKHCCSKGCHHCCSEELHVDEREADLIIDSIHPKLLAKVEAQTEAWLAKAAPLLNQEGPHQAMEWRAIDKPCPLLINGLCSVYDVRPFSCRIFFAMGNPNDCMMPQREHQKFACFEPDKMAGMMVPFVEDQKTVVMDHLGVFLAEKLLGVDLRGRTRTIFELTNQNAEQKQEPRAVESAP
jgi:Fe-S-cluster containining protein